MADFQLVLVLLVVVVALQVLAARFGIPQPAMLVVAGAALALVPGLPRPALDPDVIFLVFVPPLLYFASTRAPLRELGRQFWPIFYLSVPLVLVTMVAVAVAAHALSPAFTWPAAFVLGAIVAPPDPVAAGAVLRSLRTPAAHSAVLEGEGMFNDATALVAYRIAVVAAVTGAFSLRHAVAEFAWSGALGVVVGLLVGRAVLAIRSQVQNLPLVDNSISLLTPFAAYLLADALGGSGILAVVAAGLHIGQRLATTLSPAARIQTAGTWEMVAFLLENLILILIGLELPHLVQETQPGSLGRWVLLSAAISLVVILLRMAMVLPGALFRPAFSRTAGQIGFKDVALVGWIGMRGPESVAIALALPHLTGTGAGFPARAPIIFVTFGVVFATLVLQGLSISPLTRWLGLDGDLQPEREEAHARYVVASAGLERLEELVGNGDSTSELTNDLRHRSQRRALRWKTRERRLRDGPSSGDDGVETPALGYRRLRAAMIEAERRAVVSLRDQGVIGAEVLRRLQRDLDFEALLLEGPPQPGEQRGASPPSLPH